MVFSAIKGGRGETIYCAIVCAMKGGGGEPEQRWCLQRISLIRAHTPRSTPISCKGQGGGVGDGASLVVAVVEKIQVVEV